MNPFSNGAKELKVCDRIWSIYVTSRLMLQVRVASNDFANACGLE